MIRTALIAWMAGSFTLGLVQTSVAQQEASDPPSELDEKATAVLREMSEAVIGAQMFIIEATYAMDSVQADGRKLQFENLVTATVKRPDKLKLQESGDLTNRTLWKDSKNVTIVDLDHNVHSMIEFSGSVDEMMKELELKYNMSLVFSDLLAKDPYEAMISHASTAEYVGLHSVEEIECHHLSFTHDDLDWQIWIDAGDEPAPRKLVLTYKNAPGQPQFTGRIIQAPQ